MPLDRAELQLRATAARPCICGSTKPAGRCCFQHRVWDKKPEPVLINSERPAYAHAKCYLRGLNNCSRTISAEHYISRNVLEQIGDDVVVVGGLPWLNDGERSLRLDNLTANCLCSWHNSDLSPLDNSAGRFLAIAKRIRHLDAQAPGQRLFSGHDLERWFLKTIAGMAASGNLSDGAARFRDFAPEIDVAKMMVDAAAWPRDSGMYFFQKIGEKTTTTERFDIAPLIDHQEKITGAVATFAGLRFAIIFTGDFALADHSLQEYFYRPGVLNFRLHDRVHSILLSYQDGLGHIGLNMVGNN